MVIKKRSRKKNNERTISQFDFIMEFLPTFSGTFLDFGAGSCHATTYSREVYSIEKNIVVDISSRTQNICNRLGYDFYDYKQFAGLKNINFFFASHSVEHVNSLQNFMESLIKILSKNAYVFIEVPYLKNESDLENHTHAPHTYYFNKYSLIKIFKQYGIELLTSHSIFYIEETSVIRGLFKKS